MPLPNSRLLNIVPQRRNVKVRHGSETTEIELTLMNVTPILGGGVHTRQLDQTVDRVRVPSVRGQLRMWWRALYAHRPDLASSEAELWGGAGHAAGRRSAVEISVVTKTSDWGPQDVDPTDIALSQPHGYALFPAKATRREPAAPRWRPGRKFTVRLIGPRSIEPELRNTVRAWILFGGYGSRTRRGVGSLTVADSGERAGWLPSSATRLAFTTLFGEDVLVAVASLAAGETPLLRGAHLVAGPPSPDPTSAWGVAIGWLREFRQGRPGSPGPATIPQDHARLYGSPNRPGLSNWPEADKVRHKLAAPAGASWTHGPRHNDDPAWPRGVFGLPIVGQFGAEEATPSAGRPIPFELVWHDGTKERERLASPLVVKPMALANGQFAPLALWLFRALPGGEVQLRGNRASAAPFGKLVGTRGDASETAQFQPLNAGGNLRDIFLNWVLKQVGPAARIAP